MDPLIRTFLPLFIWNFQKIFGPVFTPDDWHAFALSFVPPPNNMVNTIIEECGDFKSSVLLSPSARRRIRNEAKSTLRRQLRNDPYLLPARHVLRKWRQELEEKGPQGYPGHIFKWRDIEANINSRWEQAIGNNDFPEELRSIAKKYPDAPNFLWELALYGRGKIKPKLLRISALFTILGLDPEQLGTGLPEDVLSLILSRVFSLESLNGDTPDETRVLRLAEWLVRNILPHDAEPETTPRALSMAKQAGLIHEAIVVRDRETAEVEKYDIKDASAWQPDDPQVDKLREKLSPDEIIEMFKEAGINKTDLTDKEWRFIFRLDDAFYEGAEVGSKKGLSLHAYFGDDCANIRQQFSRLRKKLARLKAKTN